MIRWAKQVIVLLKEISARLERIERNQEAIMRNGKAGKFIATGPQNS